MNEQDRKRNQAAINLIEDKLDRIHKRTKESQTTLLLILIIMAVICVLALGSLIRLSYIDKMQEDTLDQLMYMQQEESQAVYNEEMSSIEGIVDSDVKVALNEQDRLLVAKICMAETSPDGYMAVAQTIYDRSVLWEQDVYDVATADKQFAAPIQGKASDEALKAVDAVFSGERAFDSNVTHFHSGDAPHWTEHKEYVGSRGGNHFYDSRY